MCDDVGAPGRLWSEPSPARYRVVLPADALPAGSTPLQLVVQSGTTQQRTAALTLIAR
ncbi:hypothetical protein tb265_20280 [Gemmatimonadetes bacterium T265]|nr:hypothetical protein tb265_20280 [Gemmatimonadetes bacterium T265]